MLPLYISTLLDDPSHDAELNVPTFAVHPFKSFVKNTKSIFDIACSAAIVNLSEEFKDK